MSELKNKMTASAEETKTLRAEIDPDVLDVAVGGNDQEKGGSTDLWTCPACGETIQCKREQDKAKHMNKCPMNPGKKN